MKTTVVPNRNMILLALAAAKAISTGASQVAYAAHSGDHAIYPDCRNAFVDTMAKAISLCDWEDIELSCPFVDWTKADIVRRGAELDVPFELTWSCYKGCKKHCGKMWHLYRKARSLLSGWSRRPHRLCRRCSEHRRAYRKRLAHLEHDYSLDMLTCKKSYRDIPFAHRQHHHDGHCAFIHGHNWDITLTFACSKTDANGFVVDFESSNISRKMDRPQSRPRLLVKRGRSGERSVTA